MEPIVITTDIDRPPADVYALATDVTRFPEWQRDVAAVEMVSGAPGAKGSRFKTTRQMGPMKQSITQEVTEANPPSSWAAGSVGGAIKADGRLDLESLDGGRGTRVKFTIEYGTGTLGKLIMPIVIRQTKAGAPKSFANLKALLEH